MNMKKMQVSLVVILCATLARGQAWTWQGNESINWGDMENWTNGVPGQHPDLADFQNTSAPMTVRIGVGPFMPGNQNIDGLFLHDLQIGVLTPQFITVPQPATNLVISGKAIKLNNTINHVDLPGADSPPFEIHFHNDIALSGAVVFHNVWLRRPTRFYGTLTEFNGSRRLHGAGGGNLHYYGTVLLTGGIQNNGQTHFYGNETTGGTPVQCVPNFFSGNTYFNPPPGKTRYEYRFPPEKGVQTQFQAFMGTGDTSASFDGPVSGTGELRIEVPGILEFNHPTNTFTGGITPNFGLMIFKSEIPDGPGMGPVNGNGGLDLYGVDFPVGRKIAWNGGPDGHNWDGAYRNRKPDSEITIHSDTTQLNTCGFGGVGNILYTGDILDTRTDSVRRFHKAGPGTLTVTGMTIVPNARTTIFGGTLILDFAKTNAVKLSEAGDMHLGGKLIILGNPETNTVQTVGPLSIGQHLYQPLYFARTRISPTGRGGHSATFRFSTLSMVGGVAFQSTHFANAADFAPGTNGYIRTSQTTNDPWHKTINVAIPAPRFDALPPRITFGGQSYARVSDTDVDEDGYFLIEAVPDTMYSNNLDHASDWDFVDITGHATNNALHSVFALRFDDPAPSSLTLEKGLYIQGDWGNQMQYQNGAILVTTNVPNDVVINGPGILNHDYSYAGLTIHQYNTNAALVINAQVFERNETCLTKTGPGELVLTHTNSAFNRLCVLEGVLTVHSVANANQKSPLGQDVEGVGNDQRMVLGDATLRYKGTGHSTDRRFRVRGYGIVEASGTGPLVFTHADPVQLSSVVSGNAGLNQLLTLSGTTEGVFEGSLNNLMGGRLRKRGIGKWTLNGDSPYIIWGADVMEGRLVVNGSLGRDVTVYPGGTLAGTGKIHRDLYVNDGGILDLVPGDVHCMEVGGRLHIAEGAILSLPRKLPSDWTPVLKVGDYFTGAFTPPPHAYWTYDEKTKTFLAKLRPTGTLLMVR